MYFEVYSKVKGEEDSKKVLESTLKSLEVI